jgi:tetratricopeptide (TPR) repeat protein
MGKGILDRAESLYSRGRYLEAVRLLEPMVVHFRESFRFYRTLGLSCLNANDPGGASTYLRRARQLSPGDIDTRLALAALDIRRRDMVDAVQGYLDILEEDPGNRIASLGLETIRKLKDDDGVAGLVDADALKRLFPRTRGIPRRTVFGVLSITGGAVILIALVFFLPRAIPRREEGRPGMSSLTLGQTQREEAIGPVGSAIFILTEKEALASYDSAVKAFGEYRDNISVREANRLLRSNASAYLKAKAEAIKSYAKTPSFSDIRDVPSLQEVLSAPLIYEGCAVAWKGLAANIKKSRDKDTFDFLVGYNDKKVLSGIVPAAAPPGSAIDTDAPLELLAFIRIEPSGPWLDVISIHDLSY